MYRGFDNGPTDFEKNISMKQAKWLLIILVAVLLLIIIFG
jgi:hypothetical protein